MVFHGGAHFRVYAYSSIIISGIHYYATTNTEPHHSGSVHSKASVAKCHAHLLVILCFLTKNGPSPSIPGYVCYAQFVNLRHFEIAPCKLEVSNLRNYL